jgi:FAD/FMN-containing dehydrogenase
MDGTIEVPGEVRAAFTGELIAPADSGYDQARQVHNGLIDKRPALIAQCRTVPDIVDAVTIGREQATEISVRGGGHNVAGLGVTDGGLMIDLQNIAWAKQTFETLRPCMTDRSYVNNLVAEDGRKVHEVWGANYKRLVTVKRRYDPGNVFRLNHNIEP